MKINIIGAGLAGVTAAITLAQQNTPCNLISSQPSSRAQSVLAEGGINGVLNTMGEEDTVREHMEDTLRSGGDIADREAVRGLAEHAPELLRWLADLGVPFNMENGRIVQRSFGGQRKKRTAYARSSTGRSMMTALIDETRRYESAGLIHRYDHHVFVSLRLTGEEENPQACAPVTGGSGKTEGDSGQARGRRCTGVWIRDDYTGESLLLPGKVIFATGGLNGFFPGETTGSLANTGDAAARLFAQGVRFSNLEMIQYHPTTFGIAGKRCLVSEAARGEGGRLYVLRNGQPWYFMEEKYPELGNLMPRDVISREMTAVSETYGQVYLDLRKLPKQAWRDRLPELREELIHYLHIDPKKKPVPVEPGIHYFMGGIDVDVYHRTNIAGILAAGECCSQYHGANRLGGNSTMGAIYGGRVAAQTAAAQPDPDLTELSTDDTAAGSRQAGEPPQRSVEKSACGIPGTGADPEKAALVGEILQDALGIVRDHGGIRRALDELEALEQTAKRGETEWERLMLARAMLLSADLRRESRGAHCRRDYPGRDPAYDGMTTAVYDGGTGQIRVALRPASSPVTGADRA